MSTDLFRFQKELQRKGFKQVANVDMVDKTYSIVGSSVLVQDGAISTHVFDEMGEFVSVATDLPERLSKLKSQIKLED